MQMTLKQQVRASARDVFYRECGLDLSVGSSLLSWNEEKEEGSATDIQEVTERESGWISKSANASGSIGQVKML